MESMRTANAFAPAGGDSRREFVRVAPAPGAPIRVDINGEDFIEVLRAQDLGEGGIRIRVPHQFKGCHIDSRVSVVISLPAPVACTLRLDGRIRHAVADTFGVHFLEVDPPSRAALRRYVAARLRSERGFWHWLAYRLGLVR